MSENLIYTNNLNGSLQLNYNMNNNCAAIGQSDKLINFNGLQNINPQSTNNNSHQKLITKIINNKANKEENLKDQKRSYFAVEAGYVNYIAS